MAADKTRQETGLSVSESLSAWIQGPRAGGSPEGAGAGAKGPRR